MGAQIAIMVIAMFAQSKDARADYALTPRETEILEFLVEGFFKKEIALKSGLGYLTFDNQMQNIYTKLSVDTRTGAVAKALKEKFF